MTRTQCSLSLLIFVWQFMQTYACDESFTYLGQSFAMVQPFFAMAYSMNCGSVYSMLALEYIHN